MLKVLNDDFGTWCAAKSAVDGWLKEPRPSERIEIYVEIRKSQNIENLIYLLPIVNELFTNGMKYAVNINTVMENAEQRKDVQYKIGQFLYLIYIKNREMLASVKIDGMANLYKQTRFGNVQPIVEVTRPNLDLMFGTDLDYEILEHLNDEEVILCIISSNIGGESLKKKIQTILSYDCLVSENEKNSYLKKNKMKWGNLFYISPNDSFNIIYQKMCLSNIIYIIQNIAGVVESQKKLTEKNKIELAREVISFFLMNVKEAPLYTQYLWGLYMRYSVDAKLSINLPNQEKKTFVESMLTVALTNAAGYSDAVYQILENACLHSAGKYGYLYMRIYETGKSANMDEKIKNLQTLQKLEESYNKMKFDEMIFCYFETVIVDNAFENQAANSRDENQIVGMLDHYEASTGKRIASLEELFRRKPEGVEDVIEHYGLRVFERIIAVNAGGFIVRTPVDSGKRESVYTSENIQVDEKNLFYTGSIYKIICPLNDAKKYNVKYNNNGKEDGNLFDISGIMEKYKNLEIVIPYPEKTEIKDNDMKEYIYDFLDNKTSTLKNLQQNILCVSLDEKIEKYENIEFLAKAVAKYIMTKKSEYNKIAILFRNKYFIGEFVRIYAAFYDKRGSSFKSCGGEIKNTQIALCRMDTEIPTVCLVIAGNDLSTAEMTARKYVYYHSETCLEFVPLISYLTSFIPCKKVGKTNAIFPFDLHLYLDLSQKREWEQAQTEDDIWFFRQVNYALNADIQKKDYGCKLSNVHVSMGSKVHIDTFYNADLLLHNYATVWRLAYIVAHSLLTEYPVSSVDNGSIYLVAYGQYTELLVQLICDMMSDFLGEKVSYLMFLTEDEEGSGKEDGLWMEFRKYIRDNKFTETSTFHVILPIATTLTTIRKIQCIMRQICMEEGRINQPITFGKNISLIVVGAEKNEKVSSLYWEINNKNSKEIVIKPFYEKDKNPSVDVARYIKYFFAPECKWFKTEDCALCNGYSKCLIGVDKGSAAPKALFACENMKRPIFKLPNNSGGTWEETSDIIDLKGCVRYSHIRGYNNHFKFDIDFKKYCESESVQKKISKWVLEQVRGKIEFNAFNVIVSPQNNSNSYFLKTVIDKGFEGNVRLLNIPINTSMRDEVRTKFSYIAKEYENIKRIMGTARVHVYFVDDCIIQEDTIRRGQKLVNMLLKENDFMTNDVCVYKGIIVLINRSSYDTIRNLLSESVEDSFFAYLRLNVPLYNTFNGICPSCMLAEQYNIMHKRASTHMLANEYWRLFKKHSVKTREEDARWLEKQIHASAKNSYFLRLKQWLFYAVCKTGRGKYAYFDLMGEKHEFVSKGVEDKVLSKNSSQGKFLKEILAFITENEIREYCQKENNKEVVFNIIKKYIVEDTDFIRMICTHQVMQMIDELNECVTDIENLEKKTRENVLKIFQTRFKMIDQKAQKNKIPFHTKMWLKTEWVISYIKIMSRKQAAQHYHVRNTLYAILNQLADEMIFGKESDSEFIHSLGEMCKISPWDRSDEGIMPDAKYYIFITVIRRLSAMHSPYVIDKFEKIYKYYYKCSKQYRGEGEYENFYSSVSEKERYLRLTKMPDENTFGFTIAKLIKWTAMSGYDESKCFAIERSLNQNLIGEDSVEPVSIENGKKLAFLENTQIIYSGVKRLTNNFQFDKDVIKEEEVFEYVKNSYKNACETTTPIYYEMNPLKPFFSFMDIGSNYDYSSLKPMYWVYAKMIIFFHILQDLEKRESIVDTPYPYREICNCMRDIMGQDQCKIVSVIDRRILTIATSDIYPDYMEKDIGNREIDLILEKFHKGCEKNSFNSVVQKFKLGNAEVIVISLPMPESASVIPDSYIILYKGKLKESVELKNENSCELTQMEIWNVRNILFLRDTFEGVLQRDIVYLREQIHSYEYVNKISREENVKIWHLSDLHITQNNYTNMIAAMEDKLNNMGEQDIPDLLLITGDVITGGYSAAQIIESYDAAQIVIRKLVRLIWKIKSDTTCAKEFIHADWKKRIIISVGNHDYASMNELEAKNKHRTTTSGTPNTISNVMAKHSYFIYFIHSLLENDIDDLLQYDLNRIINYSNLNLTVVNINSNSSVNPFRTDKVRINADAVNEMFEHSNFEKNVIYMMHHTPMYNIEYTNSVYYLKSPQKVCDAIRGIINGQISTNRINDRIKTNQVWIQLLISLSDGFEKDVMGMTAEQQKNILEQILKQIQKEDPFNFQKDYLEDFLYYLGCSEPESDDKCRYIVSNIKNQIKSSKGDVEQYVSFIKQHFTNFSDKKAPDSKYIILGGHTHRAAKAKHGDMGVGCFRKCEGIYEAGKFMVGKELNYTIINVKNDEFSCHFVGEIAVDKEKEGSMLEKILDE